MRQSGRNSTDFCGPRSRAVAACQCPLLDCTQCTRGGRAWPASDDTRHSPTMPSAASGVDVISLLVRVRRIIDGSASEHRLRIEGPDEVLGEWDSERLDQVFTNLLSNAMKFSPPRSDVLLRIDTRPDDVLVTVMDEGVGLQTGGIPKFFQPFTRVARSRGRRAADSASTPHAALSKRMAAGSRPRARGPAPGRRSPSRSPTDGAVHECTRSRRIRQLPRLALRRSATRWNFSRCGGADVLRELAQERRAHRPRLPQSSSTK